MEKDFYKSVIEQSPTAYAYHRIICDQEGKPIDYEFLEANNAFEKMTGLKREEIIGKKITEILPSIKNEEFNWIDYYGQIALDGGKKSFRQFSKALKRWYKVYATSPQKHYFATYFSDITKEKEQIAELNRFFKVNLDLLCIADTHGNFIKVNEAWEDMLGYPLEELEKNKFIDFIHEDDLEKTLKEILLLKEQKQILNFVNRCGCKDGSYRYIEWSAQIYGELIYVAARDITDRKKAEEALIYQSNMQNLLMKISAKYINIPLDEVEGVIQDSLKEMGEFVESDRVYIFDYDFDEDITSNTHEWCREGIVPQIENLQNVPLKAIPDWVNTHKDGLMLLVPSVRDLPKGDAVREILEPQDIKTLITLPMMDEGKCIGFIGFDFVHQYKSYTEKEIKILELYSQMFVNVNKRKVQEKNLIEARRQAENANKLKSRFLANMSHEIRTPMNGIVGFLDLLENTMINKEQKNYIQNIKISTDSLLTVINDILDISKIESGKFELEEIKFDLYATVEAAVIPFIAKAGEKGIELNILIKPNVPRMAIGDPTRLRQIISNLVNNGIKFTEKGNVFVEVELYQQRDELNEIIIKVKDTGIGMTPETIKKIFFPFIQSETSSTRKYGGTGLGLSICKNIVEMMNGKISVESEEHKGSNFQFTVILKKVEGIEMPKPIDYNILKGKRILIVDDYEMNRHIAKVYLQEVGCMVEEAESGTDALKKLMVGNGNHYKFNAVLIDHQMEGMSGFDLAAALKAIPSTKNLPLILLTSIVGNGELQDAKKKGFIRSLTKPYRRDALLECIASGIEGKIEESEENVFLENIKIEDKINQKVKILVVEDNKINRTFMVKLLQNYDLNCDIAKNGKEAVRACLENNYDIVFMDCQMPIMDGYEATRKIRERKENTIIIAMTAYTMQGDERKCREAGMNDYIGKPLNKDMVIKMIKKWVVHKKNNYFDKVVATLMEQVAFDRKTSEEIVLDFYGQTAEMIKEIEESLHKNHMKSVSNLLHQLKGSSGNIRATEIANYAVQAEGAASNLNKDEIMKYIGKIQKLLMDE